MDGHSTPIPGFISQLDGLSEEQHGQYAFQFDSMTGDSDLPLLTLSLFASMYVFRQCCIFTL